MQQLGKGAALNHGVATTHMEKGPASPLLTIGDMERKRYGLIRKYLPHSRTMDAYVLRRKKDALTGRVARFVVLNEMCVGTASARDRMCGVGGQKEVRNVGIGG